MPGFYSKSSVLWFPLMRNPSKKSYRHDPTRRTLRIEYGPHVRFLPPKLAADLAGVSVQTVYKWIAGAQQMDSKTRALLYIRALGLLPHEVWQGWHVDENGRLTGPNGWSFYPAELLNFTYTKQLNAELQADVARLTVENAELRQAVDYLQGQRLAGNVVAFPGTKKPARRRADP